MSALMAYLLPWGVIIRSSVCDDIISCICSNSITSMSSVNIKNPPPSPRMHRVFVNTATNAACLPLISIKSAINYDIFLVLHSTTMPGIPNTVSSIVLYLPFFISTSNVILLCTSDSISTLGLYVSFIPPTI